MRKLLLSIVAASMTLAACNAQSGYKVTGTVEGMPDGKAIIATVNGSSLDTLAKADVKNGSFEFTGNVSEPTGAYIMVIGQRGAIPFMLENANITVNAGQAGLTVTGSEGQKIYDQFMAINTTTQQEAMKLQHLAQEFLDRVLRGLALELARAGDLHDHGHMDEQHILLSLLSGYLPDGLEERLRLDIADGAADLGDKHIGLPVVHLVDAGFDLVGDVRDDLHGAAEISALALTAQDAPVDLARRHGAARGQALVREALIVAEVKVGSEQPERTMFFSGMRPLHGASHEGKPCGMSTCSDAPMPRCIAG